MGSGERRGGGRHAGGRRGHAGAHAGAGRRVHHRAHARHHNRGHFGARHHGHGLHHHHHRHRRGAFGFRHRTLLWGQRSRYRVGTVIRIESGVTTYRVDCRDAFATVCLLRLVLVFGIIFMITGFILLMIGYFDNPQSREHKEDLENCRTAGWVILSIGFSLALFGCLVGCRIVVNEEDQPPEASVAERGQVPATAPVEELQSGLPQQSVSHPPQQPIANINANMQPPYPVDPGLSNTNQYPLPGAVDDVQSTGRAYDDQAPPSYASVISGHASMVEPEDVAT